MITYLMESSDEPPSSLCNVTPDRVLLGAHHSGITWSRKVAAVWGISSPLLRSGLRDDIPLLEAAR
mgnify:CR=1 FL=1